MRIKAKTRQQMNEELIVNQVLNEKLVKINAYPHLQYKGLLAQPI